MLKIVKYDFKALFRSLMPLYLGIVVMSLVLSVSLRMDLGSSTVFTIMAFVFGALILISCVLTLVLVVRRYRSSIMEDEAYLTFSLPVSTSQIVGGKLLSDVVWVVINYFVLALAGVIIVGILGGFQSFDYLLSVIRENGKEVLQVIKVGILGVIATISFISLVCTSIQTGHLFKTHQGLFSTAAFIIFVTVENYITRILIGNVNDGQIMILILLQLVWIALYAIGQWLILDKHLNLD